MFVVRLGFHACSTSGPHYPDAPLPSAHLRSQVDHCQAIWCTGMDLYDLTAVCVIGWCFIAGRKTGSSFIFATAGRTFRTVREEGRKGLPTVLWSPIYPSGRCCATTQSFIRGDWGLYGECSGRSSPSPQMMTGVMTSQNDRGHPLLGSEPLPECRRAAVASEGNFRAKYVFGRPGFHGQVRFKRPRPACDHEVNASVAVAGCEFKDRNSHLSQVANKRRCARTIRGSRRTLRHRGVGAGRLRRAGH
jgi:hypothetical protein